MHIFFHSTEWQYIRHTSCSCLFFCLLFHEHLTILINILKFSPLNNSTVFYFVNGASFGLDISVTYVSQILTIYLLHGGQGSNQTDQLPAHQALMVSLVRRCFQPTLLTKSTSVILHWGDLQVLFNTGFLCKSYHMLSHFAKNAVPHYYICQSFELQRLPVITYSFNKNKIIK